VLSGILSFSVAFYFFFIIHLFSSGNVKLSVVVASVIVFLFVYYYFKDFFDFYITNRLFGRSLAEIDNRSTYDFEIVFQKALNEGRLWFGIYKGDDIDGAGAKLFIWRYGIISLILLFVYYFNYYKKQLKRYRSKLFPAVVFFFVFWISFYQRHTITSMEYLICYVLAPLLFSSELYDNKNETFIHYS
jgi:hypothetical protein